MYKRPKGDPGPLLFPWYNRKNIALTWDRNCEGSLFTPSWLGRRRRASASSSPTTITFSPSVATQPRMPPADTRGPWDSPRGPASFLKNFYIFSTKPLDIRLSLWYIIARKDESNVLRSLIDQMSLPQTRGCVTCIKSFPDVSGSRR